MSPATQDALIRMGLAAIIWAVAFGVMWAIVRSGDREDDAPTEWQ